MHPQNLCNLADDHKSYALTWKKYDLAGFQTRVGHQRPPRPGTAAGGGAAGRQAVGCAVSYCQPGSRTVVRACPAAAAAVVATAKGVAVTAAAAVAACGAAAARGREGEREKQDEKQTGERGMPGVQRE